MAFTTNKDLHHRFSHHPPSELKIIAHSAVREDTLLLAYSWNEILPEGREKALAITKLEEAMFWANAAIARSNGTSDLPEKLPAFN